MATIILFAPLIGALICGFGWRLIGEKTGQVIADQVARTPATGMRVVSAKPGEGIQE